MALRNKEYIHIERYFSFKPSCKIKSERTAINDRGLLIYMASKMKCKFNIVTNKGQETDKVNLDVVHDPPRMEDLVPRPPVVAIVGHIGKTWTIQYYNFINPTVFIILNVSCCRSWKDDFIRST